MSSLTGVACLSVIPVTFITVLTLVEEVGVIVIRCNGQAIPYPAWAVLCVHVIIYTKQFATVATGSNLSLVERFRNQAERVRITDCFPE